MTTFQALELFQEHTQESEPMPIYLNAPDMTAMIVTGIIQNPAATGGYHVIVPVS